MSQKPEHITITEIDSYTQRRDKSMVLMTSFGALQGVGYVTDALDGSASQTGTSYDTPSTSQLMYGAGPSPMHALPRWT